MSMLPPTFPDAVVALGSVDLKGNFIASATGFIVGIKTGQKNEKGEPFYSIYLVTNRHVFQNLEEIYIRLNKGPADSHLFKLPLKDSNGVLWTMHKDDSVDIAVAIIPVNDVQQAGAQLTWFDDDLILGSDQAEAIGVRTGDEVFVLGFPMRIAGQAKNYPIVRGGVIARLDKEILESEKSYFIDAAIYGGNSGGPVILKPSIVGIEGTTAINKAYVIGVVRGVVLVSETLFGQRNGVYEPRMVINEHSDLAQVVPMQFVKEAIEHLKVQIGQKKVDEDQTDKAPHIGEDKSGAKP